MLSLCSYVQISLFSKDASHWIMGHLIQSYGLILPWLHVQRPYFKIKPHSQVLRVRISTYLSRRHNSAHNCSAVAVGPWMTSHFITLCPSAEKPRPFHGKILCYCLPLHGHHLLIHLPPPTLLCSQHQTLEKSKSSQGYIGVETAQAYFTLCLQYSTSSLPSLLFWYILPHNFLLSSILGKFK